jgi:zinc transporter
VNIDKNDPCFVFGLALDGEGGASEVSADTSMNWLHIDYSVPTASSWLQSLGLDDWVVATLTRADSRPRAVISKAGTLVVLRAINHNSDDDPEDMVSLRMWIQTNRIITVRQRKLLSIEDIKQELKLGIGPISIESFSVRLIERVGDQIAAYVDETEKRLEALELQVESERSSKTRATVSESRRKIASVRRFLAPQIDALETLYRLAITGTDSSQAFAIREQSDRIVRYIEDLDLVRERLLVLQEDLMNFMMEEQNSRMYLLSIVAVIFLPITFVSGLFGMNVAGLPGITDPYAFSYVMAGMIAISALVVALLAKKRWL